MAKIKIKGKSKFAYLVSADTGPDGTWDAQWKINLYVDKTMAAKVREVGLKATMVDDSKITVSRRVEKRGKQAGKKNNPPKVIDSDNEVFSEILGHGSTVIVTANIYKWNYKGRSGVGADLEEVKVIDLVPYVPEEGSTEESVADEPQTQGGTSVKDDDDIPF